MKINLQRKKNLLNELSDSLKKVELVTLVNFSNIKSIDFKILRKEFLFKDIKIKVFKNTLSKKLFNALGMSDLTKNIDGQNFILFSNNIFDTVKMLNDLKKRDINLNVKGAIISMRYFSKFDDLLLFNNRNDILFKLLFLLKNPYFKFINVLRLPINKLVENIKLVEKKKEA